MPWRVITPDDRRKPWERGDICTFGDTGRESSDGTGWRLAVFSVILPFPGPAADESDPLYDLDAQQWSPGRYHGLCDLELSDGGAGAKRLVAFTDDPQTRLGALIGRAVSGQVVEGAVDDGRLGAARIHHRLVGADEAGCSFAIVEPGRPGRARIGLRAVELLQFLEADADPARQIINRFLVIHVAVEHCTGSTLEAVSRAMARPRGYVRVGRPEKGAGSFEHAAGHPDDLRPLQHFGKLAIELLRENTALSGTDASISRGGFLETQRPERSDAPRLEHPRRSIAPPLRVVMAIPERSVDRPPSLLPDTEGSAWSCSEKWAWVLATGADQYVEAFPAETRRRAEQALCGEYRTWTIWASEFGLSLVRKDVDLASPDTRLGETKFMRLAQTRYVDLAVLIMRSYHALGALSGDLARIDRDVLTALAGRGEQDTDASRADQDAEEKVRLREQLRRLEEIQADFVIFRDRLWFNAVPRHMVDTRIMLTLRERSGVDRQFEDFMMELDLRRQVYSTQYAAREVEDSRRREEAEHDEALLRETERKEREQERELREEDRVALAQRGERLNHLLAIAAICFAVPTVVESFGLWSSREAGAVILVLMTVLGLAAYFLVKRWSGSQERAQHAPRDERCPDRPDRLSRRRGSP